MGIELGRKGSEKHARPRREVWSYQSLSSLNDCNAGNNFLSRWKQEDKNIVAVVEEVVLQRQILQVGRRDANLAFLVIPPLPLDIAHELIFQSAFVRPGQPSELLLE